jgi:hypothetical protein
VCGEEVDAGGDVVREVDDEVVEGLFVVVEEVDHELRGLLHAGGVGQQGLEHLRERVVRDAADRGALLEVGNDDGRVDAAFLGEPCSQSRRSVPMPTRASRAISRSEGSPPARAETNSLVAPAMSAWRWRAASLRTV